MAIARYENIAINNVTNSVDDLGQYTTTITKWFDTRARVSAVANSVRISEKYRVYGDVVEFTLNYTPNTKTIVDSTNLYSIAYRNVNWRIDSIRESDDRMTVKLLCVRNDPVVAV